MHECVSNGIENFLVGLWNQVVNNLSPKQNNVIGDCIVQQPLQLAPYLARTSSSLFFQSLATFRSPTADCCRILQHFLLLRTGFPSLSCTADFTSLLCLGHERDGRFDFTQRFPPLDTLSLTFGQTLQIGSLRCDHFYFRPGRWRRGRTRSSRS